MFTSLPTATCEADETSLMGEYVITVSGGEAENYKLSYSTGTLTVTKGTPLGISAIEDIDTAQGMDIYSVGGQLIQGNVHSLNALEKGVYIVARKADGSRKMHKIIIR